MDKSDESINDWLVLLRREDRDLLNLCRLDTFRGSGRGGQKRNKTSNAVRLTIGEIAVTESATRSRAQNIAGALRKLRLKIALGMPPSVDRSNPVEFPPEEITAYLGGGLIRINPQNPHFPILLGWLVDRFLVHEGSWAATAENCGVSASQLRRFVEKHPALLAVVKRIQSDS